MLFPANLQKISPAFLEVFVCRSFPYEVMFWSSSFIMGRSISFSSRFVLKNLSLSLFCRKASKQDFSRLAFVDYVKWSA